MKVPILEHIVAKVVSDIGSTDRKFVHRENLNQSMCKTSNPGYHQDRDTNLLICMCNGQIVQRHTTIIDHHHHQEDLRTTK